jgi:glycosyltransferase involved in cell wall biosynthesis
MKLCFFNRSYWPDQAATGQLLTELAEDLVARHGCSVSVVAGRALHGSAGAQGSLWPVSTEQRHGVRILRANGTAFSRRGFAGRASNYLSYFASAFAASWKLGPQDVVVSLTDPPILGLAALRAARRVGARFVFLCEDVFPEVAALLEDFHNQTVNRTLDRINRYLLREADAVIALGDRMKRRLVEEKGADPDRVHVIHNWADCEAITPGPKDNAFARAHGLCDRFVLMHSGNVGLSQDLDLLVEAAALLQSRERLIVAIVGDGARRQPLQEMTARRGLTNVRFFRISLKSCWTNRSRRPMRFSCRSNRGSKAISCRARCTAFWRRGARLWPPSTRAAKRRSLPAITTAGRSRRPANPNNWRLRLPRSVTIRRPRA